MLTRRSLLAALGALPFVGRLVREKPRHPGIAKFDKRAADEMAAREAACEIASFDTFTINGRTYTFVSTLERAEYEIPIGVDVSETRRNFYRACGYEP